MDFECKSKCKSGDRCGGGLYRGDRDARKKDDEKHVELANEWIPRVEAKIERRGKK